MTTAAFDAGYDAGYDGQRATLNPHPYDTEAYWNWNRGWEHGNGELTTEREAAEVDAEEYASIYD